MDSLIESEMQQIESDNPPAGGEYSQGQFSELNELYEKEISVIDMEYGDDGVDVDDGDEKTLLSRQLTFSNLGE